MRTYSPAYLAGSRVAIVRVRAACADLASADPTQSEDARLGYLQTLARIESLVLGLPGGDAIRETLIVDRGGYLPREAVGQTPREALRATLEREEERVAGWPTEVRSAVSIPGFPRSAAVDEAPAAPSPFPDPPEPATASTIRQDDDEIPQKVYERLDRRQRTILGLLAEVWATRRDLRLAQLLTNLTPDGIDPYYLRDGDLIEALRGCK